MRKLQQSINLSAMPTRLVKDVRYYAYTPWLFTFNDLKTGISKYCFRNVQCTYLLPS